MLIDALLRHAFSREIGPNAMEFTSEASRGHPRRPGAKMKSSGWWYREKNRVGDSGVSFFEHPHIRLDWSIANVYACHGRKQWVS